MVALARVECDAARPLPQMAVADITARSSLAPGAMLLPNPHCLKWCHAIFTDHIPDWPPGVQPGGIRPENRRHRRAAGDGSGWVVVGGVRAGSGTGHPRRGRRRARVDRSRSPGSSSHSSACFTSPTGRPSPPIRYSGGCYTVARENLGASAGLLAADCADDRLPAQLSPSASQPVSRALISTAPTLHPYTLPLCLGVLAALITLLNLRGTREAGIGLGRFPPISSC